jgi:hypothetical protein
MGWLAMERLKERIGYFALPGGFRMSLWWVIKRAARIEYDWVSESLIDPAKLYEVSPAPFELHRIGSPQDLAAADPKLIEQVERNIAVAVAKQLARNEWVYFLAEGAEVVSQLNVSMGPRARIDDPLRAWLEFPADSVYQSYAFTPAAHRRRRAAQKLFMLVHNDLARLGKRKAYGIVSRTNMPQIRNLERAGFAMVASICVSRGGRLLFTRGLAARSLRIVPIGSVDAR